MIADLLTLTRPLVVLDTETTGLSPQTDRIIELGFQVHKPDGGVDEWRSLIDPGIPIPPRVTKVHGITDEMMKGCRVCGAQCDLDDVQAAHSFVPIPKFAQIAPKLARGFSDCDFAGKNVRFDLNFLAEEFKRAKVEWSYAGACIIDADRLEALAKPRHLSDLHKLYAGAPHDDAHAALSDVRATTTVIALQLKTHEQLPRDLRQLHDLSWPGWVDSRGLFRIIDGEAFVQFGMHRGKPMSEVPKDYWGYIIKNDFSDEVKQIAREAVEGRFPS